MTQHQKELFQNHSIKLCLDGFVFPMFEVAHHPRGTSPPRLGFRKSPPFFTRFTLQGFPSLHFCWLDPPGWTWTGTRLPR